VAAVLGLAAAAVLLLGGCVPSPGTRTPTALRPMASATVAAIGARNQNSLLPVEDAVTRAAEALFANARLPHPPPGPSGRYPLVIDPLVDVPTASQSASTQLAQARIAEVARRSGRYDLRPFGTASLEEKPLVLLGTLAPLRPGNASVGAPTAYNLWLVLADLRTGHIVGRSETAMRVEGVDPTPTAFFRDSPVWVRNDPAQKSYADTCAGQIGDPVDPRYIEGIFASALVADAIAAYDAGRQRDALALYERAGRLPAGDQLRVHNGLFLTNWALGRRREAEAAFSRLVDLGLRQCQLAVKLVFQPGSTAFWRDPAVSGAYPLWLRRIARGAAAREDACLDVVGHASPTGDPALNDRLSLRRAERVRGLVVREARPLERRVAAKGVGSREPIVGTGVDDASDALDRRVEFLPRACGAVTASLDAGGAGGGG
jgi:hypothetical protein